MSKYPRKKKRALKASDSPTDLERAFDEENPGGESPTDDPAERETEPPIPGEPTTELPVIKFADDKSGDSVKIRTAEFEAPFQDKAKPDRKDLQEEGPTIPLVQTTEELPKVEAVVPLARRRGKKPMATPPPSDLEETIPPEPRDAPKTHDGSENESATITVPPPNRAGGSTPREDVIPSESPAANVKETPEDDASASKYSLPRIKPPRPPVGAPENKASKLLNELRSRYKAFHDDDETNGAFLSKRSTEPGAAGLPSEGKSDSDRSASEIGEDFVVEHAHGLDDQEPPESEKKFAVIIKPVGRVDHDRLIEQLAAFTEHDITTTRRAIRRGKGILARNLSRSDGIILESALKAEIQPVLLIEETPELAYETAEPVDAFRVENGKIVAFSMVARREIEKDDIRLLGAGLVGSPQRGPSGRMIIEIFGRKKTHRWRCGEDILANDFNPDHPRGQAFIELARAIRDAAPEAVRTPVFELILQGKLDMRHAYPDEENLDNYHQWILWTNFGRRV